MKPAGMSLIYIAFIILVLDEMVIAVYPHQEKRVLNLTRYCDATTELTCFEFCFSHPAVHPGMEILFPVISVANILAVFFKTQHEQKSLVTLA